MFAAFALGLRFLRRGEELVLDGGGSGGDDGSAPVVYAPPAEAPPGSTS
jgi:hypothetical protein